MDGRLPVILLAALLAVSGCRDEQALMAPADLEPAGAAGADRAEPAVAVADSTAQPEECDLIEVEFKVDGETNTVYLCRRESGAAGGSASAGGAAGADGDGTQICWYWVVEYRIAGILVGRTEQLLFCEEPEDAGGCDDEQRKMAQEYEEYDVQEREHPSCSDIEYQGAGTANFAWDELNGFFQEGNPHKHYGWVQSGLKAGIQGMRDAYGGPLPLSSGYRCPHGNASIPTASPKSWHMEGRAVDISVKTLAGVSSNWAGMTEDEQARVEAIWFDLDEIAKNEGGIDLQEFTEYDDRHYHVAW